MEYLGGETLAARLQRSPGRSLPVDEVLRVASEIADALHAAHANGIVHRDLKPANLFLTTRGQAKILDFGLAKHAEVPDDGGERQALAMTAERRELTERGSAVGTVSYMSPEQALGLTVDARSDLFSFGIVLYEMTAGARPFEGVTAAAVFDAILNKPPAPSRTSLSHVPGIETIIHKCLEKDRTLRYQSAADLRADINRVRRDLDSGSAASAIVEPGMAKRRTRELIVAAAVLAVLAIGAIGRWMWLNRAPNAGAIDSIAVLPFANASGSADADYLSDGLADSLTNSLSQIHALRVVPRSLVARYKNGVVDLRQVAHELNVRAIVTGRVTQRGDRLTVQAELIDTLNVRQLWGQQFDRRLADALGVETDLSKAIADNLRLRLTSQDQKGLAARPTENGEAYRLDLKGRYEWNRRSRGSLDKATEYFGQAIQLDPSYARAYAGLAMVAASRGFFRYAPPGEANPAAIAAATTAIRLDDRSAPAHAALAFSYFYYEWNFAKSEVEFQRALAIDPNDSVAHHWYGGTVLVAVRRFDAAIAELQRAEALDPITPMVPTILGRAYLDAGRLDEAVQGLKRSLELEPDFVPAHRYLAQVYSLSKRADHGIAEAQRAIELGDPVGRFYLAASYAASGRGSEARALLDTLSAAPDRALDDSLFFAMVYAALGDRDQAFTWLERAYRAHDQELTTVNAAAEFASLKNDPRFGDLVGRIGIPAQ
jgi:TolB-like protein/Tfp pilus assembly protein PilF